MGKHINWIQITPDESINKPIAAIQKGEEIEIISVSGDHTRIQINKENTLFANNNISINVTGDSIIIDHNQSERSLPFRIADTLKVSLFSDEDLEEQMRYIRSSLRAISVYLNTPLSITDLSEGNLGDDQDDLLVWLSNSAGKELNSTVLMWKPDSLANSLIEPGSKKNVFYLTRWLNSENIVEENLPEELIQLLNINAEIEEEIRKYDRRVMPLEEILPVTGIMGGNIEINKVRDISRYFWFLLVIILISERGLSAYRKQ